MLAALRHPGAAIRRHFETRTRGQSLVELALILPVFLLFLATVLDLGRIAAGQVAVQNAAREGAFQAAVTPTDFTSASGCPADGSTNVIYCRIKLESSGGVTINPADVTVICNPANCATGIGNTVKVVVNGHFRLLTPIMGAFFGGNQNVTFTASSVQNLETLPSSPIGLPSSPSPSPSASSSSSPSASPSSSPSPTCQLPSAGFTMAVTGSNSHRAPQTVTVTDTSTSQNCGIDSWIWDWGDGTTGSGQVPGSHSYLVPNPDGTGYYTIKLTVRNAAGAKTSGGQQVQVK
jgi:PKD repeat protein